MSAKTKFMLRQNGMASEIMLRHFFAFMKNEFPEDRDKVKRRPYRQIYRACLAYHRGHTLKRVGRSLGVCGSRAGDIVHKWERKVRWMCKSMGGCNEYY